MNPAQHVEITDQFISRLISSTDAGGSHVESANSHATSADVSHREAPAYTPAADSGNDPGDNPAHAITNWAHSHNDVPAYN